MRDSSLYVVHVRVNYNIQFVFKGRMGGKRVLNILLLRSQPAGIWKRPEEEEEHKPLTWAYSFELSGAVK